MDCSFCGHEISRGTEKIYITKRGKALYFCSGKCQKNMLKLKRKPGKVRWTDSYREEKAIRVRSMPATHAPRKEVKKDEGGKEELKGSKKKEKKTEAGKKEKKADKVAGKPKEKATKEKAKKKQTREKKTIKK